MTRELPFRYVRASGFGIARWVKPIVWVHRWAKAPAGPLQPVCESSSVCCSSATCPVSSELRLLLSLIIMFRKLGSRSERREKNSPAGSVRCTSAHVTAMFMSTLLLNLCALVAELRGAGSRIFRRRSTPRTPPGCLHFVSFVVV